MQKKRAIKVIIFLVMFGLLFCRISKVFRWSVGDQKNYPRISEFFEERENSLDAVYIGSSSTFAFWQAPIAWEKYGIAIRCMASNGQPLAATKWLIDDARRKQPDALYIIAINTMYESTNDTVIHYLTDKYPFSINKMKMIWGLSDMADIAWSERLEFFFPIIRYHTRWNALGEADFDYASQGIKSGSVYTTFLERVEDVTKEYKLTTEIATNDEIPYDMLVDLLDYCKENEVRVLFVTAPQALQDEEKLKKYNAANALIESYGFDSMDMIPMVHEMGLDMQTDFYNARHVNVHGSIKYTLWFGRYLKETYGFTDKRFDTAYADWEQESLKYMEIIKNFISEEEYQMIVE